jgi:hypothetical protein
VSESTEPVLRVVKGDPTAEELAAVVAVLSAGRSSQPPVEPSAPSGWSAYWRSVRAPLVAGPGAWRSSGRIG